MLEHKVLVFDGLVRISQNSSGFLQPLISNDVLLLRDIQLLLLLIETSGQTLEFTALVLYLFFEVTVVDLFAAEAFLQFAFVSLDDSHVLFETVNHAFILPTLSLAITNNFL